MRSDRATASLAHNRYAADTTNTALHNQVTWRAECKMNKRPSALRRKRHVLARDNWHDWAPRWTLAPDERKTVTVYK